MKNDCSKWVERRVESGVYRFFHGLVHGLVHVVFGAGVCLLFGYAVMGLWNWLMPEIAGWERIGFWQAVGLLVLCRLLFGGLGSHWMRKGHHGRHHRNAIREKWMEMSAEEKREFMKNRIHHPGFGPGQTFDKQD
jgi:uncharacterized membrane protein YeiB